MIENMIAHEQNLFRMAKRMWFSDARQAQKSQAAATEEIVSELVQSAVVYFIRLDLR